MTNRRNYGSQSFANITIQPRDFPGFIDQKEAWCFQSFQSEVAHELVGIRVATSPWSYTILQACQTEPFVLRAVVAIASLNKSIKMERVVEESHPSVRATAQQAVIDHREFALLAYSKAVQGMRHVQLVPGDASSLRRVLLACLLVYCMETYLQSPKTAITQCQTGCEVLHQWLARDQRADFSLGSPVPTVVEDEIYQEFARLDMETALALGKHASWHESRRISGEATIKNMPADFKSFNEARLYQTLLMRRTYHLIGEVYAHISSAKTKLHHLWTEGTPGELVDPCFLPTFLYQARDQYLADLARWRTAFAPQFAVRSISEDHVICVTTNILQSQVIEAEISLCGAFFTSETEYDAFLPQFREIHALALSSMMSCRGTYVDMKPVFNISGDYQRSLQTLATHCRDRSLREHTLSMMTKLAPRAAAKLRIRQVVRLSYITALEERHRLPDGTIPEEGRYRLLSAIDHEGEEGGKDFTVVCARRTSWPLGKGYPADREYAIKTFSHHEADNLIMGEDLPNDFDAGYFPHWPATLPKPGFIKWREVHQELRGCFDDEGKIRRVALGAGKFTFNTKNLDIWTEPRIENQHFIYDSMNLW